jgi:hypothetical protein
MWMNELMMKTTTNESRIGSHNAAIGVTVRSRDWGVGDERAPTGLKRQGWPIGGTAP